VSTVWTGRTAEIIITLYNGDHGWDFDRSGITELPATSTSEFQETGHSATSTISCVCASRKKGFPFVSAVATRRSQVRRLGRDRRQPGAQFRLCPLTVPLTFGSAQRGHTKDEEDPADQRRRLHLLNYQLKDSVWMPLQISREHNGRRGLSDFLRELQVHPGFSDDIFEKSSLSKQGSRALAKRAKTRKSITCGKPFLSASC